MTTPIDALRRIQPVTGWSNDTVTGVTFTGGLDPVVPTPFKVGVAGAATIAAAGLAAAKLWEMRSGTYMKLGNGELAHARHSIMGTYPSKDGRWSYLHCNFPNHRAA